MQIEKSLPVRGEWIEINVPIDGTREFDVSLPVRGEWIEMVYIDFI